MTESDSSEFMQKREYEKTFWEKVGKPKHVLAPMVDLSELPFRLLCRKYNCHLTFTPMLHSRNFVEHEKYRKGYFKTCDIDKPVIAQFCGNNSNIILNAIDIVKNEVTAVDLNLGCPQQIAKKGNYGAFLLHKHDEVVHLVSNITNNCDIPITCKIRKIDEDYQKTLNLCYDLQSRNVQMITVHGRTKEEKGINIKQCDYEIIKIIKERLSIPIIANGSIENFDDIQKCLSYTKANAVMCAEIILEKPHFFSNKNTNIVDIANEYYDLFLKYESNTKYLKGHLFKMLYKYFQVHTDLRDLLNDCHTINDYLHFQTVLNEKRNTGVLTESTHSWYRRYRKSF
ncbi:tRNA-dihydrouridine synthase, putative [Plasmodium ovale]|uniref:tRNA-dihydrouridine synthase n=2 Tax=Plasmodium ovale TaxID=36330 RepID=A0A1A8W4J8_PLAOA|nr:tRNA-dihydrouridine synthase, putative [Plasmodium ovale curtisi]SBS97763.1 tRNA-dihydrouridine synthase, putative [Plasmodium ovale curtisi]SCP06323.1 tRNA-dihydrouridine synthase, putative [Plasmodium ovale]